MIPKIIHYCWFGKRDFPKLVKKCMRSWDKFCPDYEIVRWDETNFSIDLFSYTREAYDVEKFAFVADVARLYALYHHGGIYLDTDMELIKPIDNLLTNHGFSGFESNDFISAGIIGAEKGIFWIEDLLMSYEDDHFKKDVNTLDLTTIVHRITEISKNKYGALLNGAKQKIKYDVELFPVDFFYPKNFRTKKTHITENTYAIHHFSMSWKTSQQKIKDNLLWMLKNNIGEKNFLNIKKIIKHLVF